MGKCHPEEEEGVNWGEPSGAARWGRWVVDAGHGSRAAAAAGGTRGNSPRC